MITLYHCLAARSFRPLWTLEEMGLPYTLNVLPFPPRFARREYLDINPLGTVPAFFDDETGMTESAAICQYLVERYGPTPLAVSKDEAGFGAWLNWLHFGEATLTFPQTLILRYSRFETAERRQPQVVSDYSRWFLARLRGIEAIVSTQEFLCAGRFTVADISVGYALLLADLLGLASQFPPGVLAYWQRLKARPAYLSACQAELAAAEAQGVSTVLSPLIEPTAS